MMLHEGFSTVVAKALELLPVYLGEDALPGILVAWTVAMAKLDGRLPRGSCELQNERAEGREAGADDGECEFEGTPIRDAYKSNWGFKCKISKVSFRAMSVCLGTYKSGLRR